MSTPRSPDSPSLTFRDGGRWPHPAQAEVVATESLECPTCCSGTSRNLVICIDGTSNQFGEKNTNVVELYSRLVKDDSQLTFYNSGIGTYAKPSWRSWSYRKQVVKNVLDLAFALRFEKIVLSAYAWLVDHYTDKDRIFLFGFSRGAYQVRALSAMIDMVGLLHKGNNDQIPFAYELYAAGASSSPGIAADQRRAMQIGRNSTDTVSMSQRFKETFSRSVKVHYVGAWDTVSSVGFIRDKTLPGTTDGMQHVCFFRHALALHEYRVKFLPEYANGGDGPCAESQLDGNSPHIPHTKEVWFSGSHSDIGGGNATNTTLDRFGPALRWMSFEAMLAGLKIKEGPRQWEPLIISRSLSPIWWFIEFLPIKRLSYTSKNSTTWMPHRATRRVPRTGQYVHSTAKADCGDLVPNLYEEPDAYRTAEALLHSLTAAWFDERSNDDRITPLKLLWSSQPGRQSLLDLRPQFQDALSHMETLCKDHANIGRAKEIMDQLVEFRKILAARSSRTTQPLSKLLGTAAEDNYETCGFPLGGHHSVVRCVAFLSRRFVVSASWDRSLRIWDIFTGSMVGEPLSHDSLISWVSVARDGKTMASCANDGTVRIWKLDDEGRLVRRGPVLRPDPDYVCWGVVYVSQGDLVVSGSGAGKIKIWDATTGQQIGSFPSPHSEPITSLAVSTDGARLASASIDATVVLWDAHSRRQIGAPMNGHTAPVISVAFSPSGDLIASSSADHTIRIWTTATQETKFSLDGPVGHEDQVYTVAFSPDGRHLASASWDGTVRIWDVQTGVLRGTLKGHDDRVFSVAFSPDGTRLVSGGNDNAVRVWDRIDV